MSEHAHTQPAAVTHVGRVRKANEDSILLLQHEPASCLLAVVADGMGGHRGGATASATVVDYLREAWEEWWSSHDRAPDVAWLPRHVMMADSMVRDKAAKDESLHGMGSTVVSLLLHKQAARLVHVGDSRAYRFHGGKLLRLTRDHSVVQGMIDEGELTEAEAEKSPMRHYLTRSIGAGEPVSLRDSQQVNVWKGDRLLLCSDGLTGMLTEQEMAGILSQESQNEAAVQRLLQQALDRGATDNVSIVLCSA